MDKFVVDEFGWRRYKRVGTNPELLKIYKTASIFFSLIKMDLFMSVLLIIMASFFLFSTTLQIALNVVALCFSFILALLGHFAVMSILVCDERI